MSRNPSLGVPMKLIKSAGGMSIKLTEVLMGVIIPDGPKFLEGMGRQKCHFDRFWCALILFHLSQFGYQFIMGSNSYSLEIIL